MSIDETTAEILSGAVTAAMDAGMDIENIVEALEVTLEALGGGGLYLMDKPLCPVCGGVARRDGAMFLIFLLDQPAPPPGARVMAAIMTMAHRECVEEVGREEASCRLIFMAANEVAESGAGYVMSLEDLQTMGPEVPGKN